MSDGESLKALPGFDRFDVPVTGMFDLPPEQRDDANARVGVIPVAYDATSTWQKGADLGPAAMLGASAEVEYLELETRTTPGELGIITRTPIVQDGPPEPMCDAVEQAVAQELDQGRLPVVLGGEHSVSIGAIRACAKKHDDLVVVQIDAHGDTRDEYHGSKCNHACVMARAKEVAQIIQVGIRALDPEELRRMNEERVIFGVDIAGDPGSDWIRRVVDLIGEKQSVYVTIDLDAFDPSLMPATGTPEPGGMTWRQVTRCVDAVIGKGRLVGFDVVELCARDGQHASEFLAARLVQRVLGGWIRSR